jgi:Zn2+/Cd2+-exporting ATPase
MDRKLRLDLPLVLPDIPDTRDACVGRVVGLLAGRPGIGEAHVVAEDSGWRARRARR